MSDVRAQFGPVAEKYLTSKAHDQPEEIALVLDRLGVQGGTVVDVGTGAGHLAYALAHRVDKVVAVDVTPQMLDVVKAESVKRGLENVTTRLAAAEDMGFADGSVNGVASRLAAHHFTDVAAFVADAARSLVPGGWLLVVDTMSPEDNDVAQQVDAFERRRDPSHVWNLKASEWEALATRFGLVPQWHIVRRKPLDFADWTERMRVSDADTQALLESLENAENGFKDYMAPRREGGRLWFDLHEIAFAATKT
ncbi:MAG: class I SAM-dependent methyltransferase [Armatimonadetes bacterium]|nr:class I SAM-dependent methyltransferase [Armatimonadota bacterium]